MKSVAGLLGLLVIQANIATVHSLPQDSSSSTTIPGSEDLLTNFSRLLGATLSGFLSTTTEESAYCSSKGVKWAGAGLDVSIIHPPICAAAKDSTLLNPRLIGTTLPPFFSEIGSIELLNSCTSTQCYAALCESINPSYLRFLLVESTPVLDQLCKLGSAKPQKHAPSWPLPQSKKAEFYNAFSAWYAYAATLGAQNTDEVIRACMNTAPYYENVENMGLNSTSVGRILCGSGWQNQLPTAEKVKERMSDEVSKMYVAVLTGSLDNSRRNQKRDSMVMLCKEFDFDNLEKLGLKKDIVKDALCKEEKTEL